jgi:hypothetical protein
MYDDNFKNIVNTDYSSVIIDLMQKRNESCAGMSWEVMDINDLKYDDYTFDCVLEKVKLNLIEIELKIHFCLLFRAL